MTTQIEKIIASTKFAVDNSNQQKEYSFFLQKDIQIKKIKRTLVRLTPF